MDAFPPKPADRLDSRATGRQTGPASACPHLQSMQAEAGARAASREQPHAMFPMSHDTTTHLRDVRIDVWPVGSEQVQGSSSDAPPLDSTALLRAISVAQQRYINRESARILFGELLESLLKMTSSEYGFIGDVLYTEQGVPYLITKAITNLAWNEETRALYEERRNDGFLFENLDTLFGAALRHSCIVISNDPSSDPRAAGTPAGHPPLKAFLGNPLFDGQGKMIGMVGLANRPSGYDTETIDFLEPLVLNSASIVMAYHEAQRREAVSQELVRLNESLEQRVAERTRDLQESNVALKSEMAVRDAAERLAEEALQARSCFFRDMSHELRTPLNGVIGACELLALSSLTDEQHHAVQLAVQNSRALVGIVNNILNLDKLSSGKLVMRTAVFSARLLLDEALMQLSHQAHKKGLFLVLDFPENVPYARRIVADNARMAQVLTNLLANAIKFTSKGGISVSARVVPPSRRKAETAEEQVVEMQEDNKHASSSGMLAISVRDSGLGIAVDRVAQLFQPFSQVFRDASTRVDYGGTGLGLAICKEIVEANGGTISAFSDGLGHGATFTFTVPLARADSISGAPPVALPRVDEERRILVVAAPRQDTCGEQVLVSLRDALATLPWAHVEFDVQPDEAVARLHAHPGQLHAVVVILPLAHMPCQRRLVDRVVAADDRVRVVLLAPTGAVDASSVTALRSASSNVRCLPLPIRTLNLAYTLANQPAVIPVSSASQTKQMRRVVNGDTLRMLLVDDVASNLMVGKMMLKKLGVCNVATARNGAEAVEWLRLTLSYHDAESNPCDVVLMDEQMPVLSGTEATRLIRSIPAIADTLIIGVSAAASHNDTALLLAAGMSGALAKPLTLAKLSCCLQEYLPSPLEFEDLPVMRRM